MNNNTCKSCGKAFAPRPGSGRQPAKCLECRQASMAPPVRHGSCSDCGTTVHGQRTGSIPKRCQSCKTAFYNRKRQVGVREIGACIDCATEIVPTRPTGVPPKRCPECRTAAARASQLVRVERWRAANPDAQREASRRSHEKRKLDPNFLQKKRDAELRRSYGLTRAELNGMREAQSEMCAICSRSHVGPGTRLHVDHCHVTGKVRSLLCGNCNTLLGLADDSPERLEAAARYLREHSSQ